MKLTLVLWCFYGVEVDFVTLIGSGPSASIVGISDHPRMDLVRNMIEKSTITSL